MQRAHDQLFDHLVTRSALTTRMNTVPNMTEHDTFTALQAENARLEALLDSHSIEWRVSSSSRPAPTAPAAEPEPEPLRSSLSTTDKVALLRRLFRGRTDVYPVRWEGKTSGKSGYAPACANLTIKIPQLPRYARSRCSGRLTYEDRAAPGPWLSNVDSQVRQ